MTIGLPADAGELRRRFTFRPELDLLYDRRHGLEHRLDPIAAAFVTATFEDPDPVEALTRRYRAPVAVLEADLRAMWAGLLDAGQHPHPRRRSGAPPEWARVDVAFPLALEVELTRACNWHCGFCYNVWKVADEYGVRGHSDTATAPGVHMDLDLAREIIAQAATGRCLRMRFSGGEPTLHPHYRQILAEAAAAGMDTELFTNGVRMNPTEAARLADNGLRVVLVSVHGLDDTHNEMARNPAAATHAWRGIRTAVGAGMTTIAEALVCEENLAEMPVLTRRLVETGVENVSFMPYVPYGPLDPRRAVAARRLSEVIDECSAELAELRITVPCAPKHCLTPEPVPITEPVREEFDQHCAAGLLWASVSVDARLRHCPHSSVYAGAVTDGIAGLWQTRVIPTVRAATAPAGACGTCGQFDACGGGCHLNKITSYDSSGEPGAGRTLLPLTTTGHQGTGCAR